MTRERQEAYLLAQSEADGADWAAAHWAEGVASVAGSCSTLPHRHVVPTGGEMTDEGRASCRVLHNCPAAGADAARADTSTTVVPTAAGGMPEGGRASCAVLLSCRAAGAEGEQTRHTHLGFAGRELLSICKERLQQLLCLLHTWRQRGGRTEAVGRK